jgi:hypothetical protein
LLATTPERPRYQNMRSFMPHSNTELSYAARLMPVRRNRATRSRQKHAAAASFR